MATSLGRLFKLSRTINASSSRLSSVRRYNTDAPVNVVSASGRRTLSVLEQDYDDIDLEDIMTEDAEYEDTTTLGHMVMREQRQTLEFLRLIEHEMPKLVAFRKPFVAPTDSTPVAVRSIDYAGEEHPATKKRVIVVPVDKLPLKDSQAIHKVKLLAGPRWTPNPPADAGVAKSEEWGNGYIKIACENFPEPEMNLKWASDVLDRLIAEANSPNRNFAHLPVDMRHVYAKVRKAKKGDHLGDRALYRPTIRDFPKSWLPQ